MPASGRPPADRSTSSWKPAVGKKAAPRRCGPTAMATSRVASRRTLAIAIGFASTGAGCVRIRHRAFNPKVPLDHRRSWTPPLSSGPTPHGPVSAPTGQVIYEMHVGTFTPEGNWRAALERLTDLADLGVTVIEMMPVADFAGRFGWGYDGVCLYAPTRLYGDA